MRRDGSSTVSGPEAAMIYLDRLNEIQQEHNAVNAHYDALEGALLTVEGGLVQLSREVAGLPVPEDIKSAKEEAVRAIAGLRRVLEPYQRPSSL